MVSRGQERLVPPISLCPLFGFGLWGLAVDSVEFEGFVRTDLLDELEFRVSEFEVRVHLAESNASSDQLLFAHKRACSRGSTRGQQEGAASSARVRALAQRERALRMAPRGEERLVRPTSLCPPPRVLGVGFGSLLGGV